MIGNITICGFVESVHRTILGIHISNERNIFVAENFIRSLVDKYCKHTVYTDGVTWYPKACKILRLKTLFAFTIRAKSYRKSNTVF